MCLVLRRNQIPQTATKDIVCIKKLANRASGRFFSLHQGFRYVRHKKLTKVDFPKKFIAYTSYGGEGFHSWHPDRFAESVKLKSFTRSDVKGSSFCIFVIPKGSKYIYSKHSNEYLSSAIKLVGKFTGERFDQIYDKGKAKKRTTKVR